MDDRELLRQFESCELPFELWTHRAHVKVAFLYLRGNSFARALEKMRAGIQAYNQSNNRPDGPREGYNETTTRAFLQLIAVALQTGGAAPSAPNADAFCDAHPHLLDGGALDRHYSPERRLNAAAKTRFVEPDREPLPLL